jgi:hypothetical protein
MCDKELYMLIFDRIFILQKILYSVLLCCHNFTKPNNNLAEKWFSYNDFVWVLD